MKLKIIKINASFSLKKNLERFENADIWFSAEAEVGAKDKADDVAEAVHEFVKKLAVKKYNSFSRNDLGEPSKSTQQPYLLKDGKAYPNPSFQEEPGYMAVGTKDNFKKVLIDKEKNTIQPI